MKFKVKSQLDHVEKGGILDDCGPSSTAAAVAWASKYVVDPSAGDGINAKAKATGFVEKEGVSDNGSSLGDLIKTAKELGAKARYAKSWDDVVLSAHRGAGLIVWVQQAVDYPPVEISEWHKKWQNYWLKKDKKHIADGYGHMTAACWDAADGWQWACPTRSGKGKEKLGVVVTEEQLKQIAASKKKITGGAAHKHVVIVEWK
jgi:hypothetical protein